MICGKGCSCWYIEGKGELPLGHFRTHHDILSGLILPKSSNTSGLIPESQYEMYTGDYHCVVQHLDVLLDS